MSTSPSVYAEVTQAILRELEQGTVPWVKPWTPAAPYNAATNRPYAGINILLLWRAQEAGEFASSAWLTFQKLGGTVRKGTTGTRIVYRATVTRTEVGDDGEERERPIPLLKRYTVFNVAQTEGLPPHLYRPPTRQPVTERLAPVAEFLRLVGARVRHGAPEAAYRPRSDVIALPPFEAFESMAHYFATSCHEHCHWTGHRSRLNRDLSARFGTRAYAAEELVAELAAAFLCAHFEVPGRLRHAEYIGAWWTLLNNDARAIFTAARRASEATEYLFACSTQAARAELSGDSPS